MRQVKKRLEDRPVESKYAKKRRQNAKAQGIVTGSNCPPAHVINREAVAYLKATKEQGK